MTAHRPAPTARPPRSGYRRLALRWRPLADRGRGFHLFAGALTLWLIGLGLALDRIEVPERPRVRAEIPERVARFIDQREPPPPPAPAAKPPPPPPAVTAPTPAPTPAETPRVTRERQPPRAPTSERETVARERAAQTGVLAHAAALRDLLDTESVAARVQSQTAPREAAARARVDSGALTANARADSGGVSGQGLAAAAGNTQLSAVGNSAVDAALASAAPDTGSEAGGQQGGASRTHEEITLVVDRYKSQLQALYNRARRTNPSLKGKLILAITIQPSGAVSAVKVVQSELNDANLVASIVARVKTFDFLAKDVAVVTVNYPIEFLP